MSYIRLYEAEEKVEWSAKAAAHLDEREAQRLADAAAKWLRSKGYYLPRSPQVVLTHGKGSRAHSTGEIRFGSGRPFRWILLHEVAHLVSIEKRDLPGWDGEEDARSHGRAFASVFLLLVGHYCGAADKKALAAAFRAEGVRYVPKRKREMDPEAKAALVARLNANRPAASPHRYTLVLRDGPTVPVASAEIAGRRNRSTHMTIPAGDPRATGPVYVSPASGDYVHYQREEPTRHGTMRQGTIDPERALTRATVEALERSLKKCWWVRRAEWDIVDIADALAEIKAAEDAAAAEQAAAAEREEYAERLRCLIRSAIDRETDIELLELALSGADPAAYEALTTTERMAS